MCVHVCVCVRARARERVCVQRAGRCAGEWGEGRGKVIQFQIELPTIMCSRVQLNVQQRSIQRKFLALTICMLGKPLSRHFAIQLFFFSYFYANTRI